MCAWSSRCYWQCSTFYTGRTFEMHRMTWTHVTFIWWNVVSPSMFPSLFPPASMFNLVKKLYFVCVTKTMVPYTCPHRGDASFFFTWLFLLSYGKVKEAQKVKAKATCEGHELKNSFNFKYLGSIFSADGSHVHDVKRRCALAESRCGDLRHVFGSKTLPLALRIKFTELRCAPFWLTATRHGI